MEQTQKFYKAKPEESDFCGAPEAERVLIDFHFFFFLFEIKTFYFFFLDKN